MRQYQDFKSLAFKVPDSIGVRGNHMVTLIMAAMVGQDGQIEPDSVQSDSITKTWAGLDSNTQAALEKSADIISAQMKVYDRRIQARR